MGAFKVTSTLAALVRVTLVVSSGLIQHRQAKERLLVEGTFKRLCREGVGSAAETDRRVLIQNLEPWGRESRLYLNEKLLRGDLDHVDLDWALVTPSTTSVVKLAFSQRFEIPIVPEVVDPLVPLRRETGTIEGRLVLDLDRLRDHLRRFLTIVYEPDGEDEVRNRGRFVVDVGEREPIRLAWEDDPGGSEATAASTRPLAERILGLFSRTAWAEELPPASVFDALDEPANQRRILELLSSSDLKRQLLAREALVERGVASVAFLEAFLAAPPAEAPDEQLVLHNLAKVVEGLEGGGEAVPVEVLGALASALYRVGDFEAASSLYERVPGSDTEAELFHLRKGISFYQTGRYEASAAEFEKTLAVADDLRVRTAEERNLLAARGKAARPVEADEGASGGWVVIGTLGRSGRFERAYFDVTVAPEPGDEIRALEAIHTRTAPPTSSNGWQPGPPTGVVAPRSDLVVREVRRSGAEDETVWARVVPADG